MTTGIGEALREAREEQERTAQAVALSLKVRTDHVLALEREDWEVFGADAYARGHLRNYARELGLDPAPLMAEYDLNVSTEDRTAHMIADGPVSTRPREPLPGWVSMVGVAVLVLVALVVVGQLFGDRTPEPAPQVSEEAAAPTSSVTTTVTANPTPTATTPASASPTVDGVNLTLDFIGASWVRITVDGEVVQEGVVEQGQVREVAGTDLVIVRYGRPGDVEVSYNGEALGTPGANDQVVTVEYTPEGPGTPRPDA